MAFISDEELNAKLSQSPLNPTGKPKTDDKLIISPTRQPSLVRKNRTEEQKVLIGALAQIDKTSDVAEAFGTSPVEVRKLKKAADDYSAGTDPNLPKVNQDLDSKIQNLALSMKSRLSNLASQKLEGALERITDEKLDEVKTAKELSIISSSLAKVTSSLTEEIRDRSEIHVHLFRPRMREEEEYEVISVEN